MVKTASKPKPVEAQPVVEEETHDITRASQEISDKASRELAELRARNASATEKLTQAQTEIAELQARNSSHQDRLASLRQTLTTLEGHHRDAVGYASVAIGTTGEQPAYNAVIERKGKLDRAAVDFDNATKEYEHIARQDELRVQELNDARRQAEEEIQFCQSRAMVVEDVRARSLAELGQSLYEESMRVNADFQEKIDAAKAALVDAQIAQQQFLQSEYTRYKAYPTYQRMLKKLMPEDNATLRVLRAECNYIDTLLTDGRVADASGLPGVNGYYNWRMLLCVTADELFVNETLAGNPRSLRTRRQILNSVIDQYIAKKL